MQPISNESDSTAWNQIAPLLEEALNCLGEKEHDAVVLRFFDGKELKNVGEAMGTTEDAARMRVNRGIEKLRAFFTKRGVTLSSAAIAGAVSANSVQAAPAGLAAGVTAAALSGTAITAAVIAASKAVTMTTLQKTIVAGLIAAAAGTGIYQARQISRLREQNQTLEQGERQSAERILHLNQERDRLAGKLVELPDNKELQRLRKERLELMSLRGRVRQLTDELRQLKAVGRQGDSNSGSAPEPNDADSILFSASVTNHVGSGQTLVVGGWSLNGMRGYLLLTPAIRQSNATSDGQPLAIQSQVVGAPESFWTQIGWADAKSDARRSSLAGVLTSEQLDTLLTALKGTEGSELSNTSLAEGGDGERVGVGFSISGESGDGALMGIDLYPRIGADGQSVELEARPSAVSTNTPIYPSLKSAK